MLLFLIGCRPKAQLSGVKNDSGLLGDITWTETTRGPVERFEGMGTVVDGKLVVLGGETNITGGTTADVQIFDVETKVWEEGPDLPVALTHAGVATVDGFIYVVGGFKGNIPITNIPPSTSEVWRWNFRGWREGNKDLTWESGPALPKAQAALSLVYLGSKLHAISGLGPDGQTDVGDHWVLNLKEDWNSASWSKAAPLPEPRNHLGGVVLNNEIYVFGGRKGWDDLFGHQRGVHSYSPIEDKWVEKAPIPFELQGAGLSHHEASTLVYNNKAILIGGQANLPWPFVSKVRVYDPDANQWSSLRDLPQSRKGPVAGIVGQSIIVTSGLNLSSKATATTWIGCCL
jgi:N-acetylneuraminic acid mutarotase